MKTIGRKLIQSGTTGKRFVERKIKERQKELDVQKTLVCYDRTKTTNYERCLNDFRKLTSMLLQLPRITGDV